jgi:hypothetical protein
MPSFWGANISLTRVARCGAWIVGVLGLSAATINAAPLAEQSSSDANFKLIREVRQHGYRVELDLSTQMLHLSMPQDTAFGMEGHQEVPITSAITGRNDYFVSASVLAQKGKQFDDGLYAAVELAAQQGLGALPGKRQLLDHLAHTLTAQSGEPTQPVVVLMTGARLGQPSLSLPLAMQPSVRALTQAFIQDEVRSKPLGFYSSNEQLSMIFRQDRILQTELTNKVGIEAIVRALHANANARSAYEGYLALAARLTNPLAYPDLRGQLAALDRGELNPPGDGLYFFPPSRSHESDMLGRLYGPQPIPEGFNLVDELIKQIRSARISLQPTAPSGWYDYQTWALEPMIVPEKMPEASRLEFDGSYTEQLLQLFKGILALTRETHVKQLETPRAGAAAPSPEVVVEIRPEMSAEPLATYYFRRAWSYYFIRSVLEAAFGPEAVRQMRRPGTTDPVHASLAEELRIMEAIFYGAHVTISRQLGLLPIVSPHLAGGKPDETPFSNWRSMLADDPDVGRDSRMMVPVFYDIARRKTKVWVFLGWSSRPMRASFARQPATVVFDQAGRRVREGVRVSFGSAWYDVAYPVMNETYVTRILDREEFRRHCDQYKTRKAILEALQ